MGAQLRRNAQAYSQLLFGREREEGLLLEKPPPSQYPFKWYFLPQVRGGSVSRRELAQLQRRSPHLAWVHNSEGTHKLIPSYSSGGSAREGLLLEKPPPSQRELAQLQRRSPHLAWVRNSEGTHKLIPSYSSGGSAREGLLLEKPPPSQRELAQLQRRSPHLAWVHNSEGTHKLIPSYSSGGARGRGFS